MGRHWYTARAYAAAVAALVRDRERFGLGADMMSGFPGETESDHRTTLGLIDELPFTYLHVFPFSLRPGTAAVRLGPAVPAAVVDRRSAELREVAARKALSYRARRAGGLADVIVTRGGARCEGVSEDFLTVRIAGGVARGTRLRARLTHDGDSLLATPEAASAEPSHYLSAS
jgi:threonylcarbamoyladenosine tRNA methylthiotransferase MtaB